MNEHISIPVGWEHERKLCGELQLIWNSKKSILWELMADDIEILYTSCIEYIKNNVGELFENINKCIDIKECKITIDEEKNIFVITAIPKQEYMECEINFDICMKDMIVKENE